MFHELIRMWFEWVQTSGYLGVFVLMAFESSIVPVPSEIVMAPAGFWAAQGKMSFIYVVVAGTVGSYVGSLLSYLAAKWISRFIPSHKLDMAKNWVNRFGTFGVFTARFLPVVRHLISIPAGLFEMPLLRFSIATTIGAGMWCTILAWFGGRVLGENPSLLDSPEVMVSVIQTQMHWFIGAAICLAILYGIVVWFKSHSSR